MAEKVLTHFEDPCEVHWVTGNFVASRETLCGERMHSCCCIHIINDKIPVTCSKCLEICEKLIEEV